MKPLGRRHYNNKSGGKHHIKIKGKYHAWWTDVVEACQKRDRQEARAFCREGWEGF